MAYLDTRGLNDLWARISALFARRNEAVGSATLNTTTLQLVAVDGTQLGTINLSNGLAADSEAAGTFTFNGGELAIKNVDGSNNNSFDFDARYARGLTYVESTKKLTLRDGNGNALSTVTLS